MPAVYDKEDERVYDDGDTRQNLSQQESAAGIHDDTIPDSGKKYDYSRSLAALENSGGNTKKDGDGESGDESEGGSSWRDKRDKVKETAKEGKSDARQAAGAAAAIASGNNVKGLLEAAKIFSKRKKKGIVGTISAVFITILLVAGVFFTLPLKVLSITTNLQDIFWSSVEDAANRMDDNLIRHYFVKHVVLGMVKKNGCTSTRATKSCAEVSGEGNIVTQLYRAWRDSNLEGKLATDYGIEIRREGNRFFMRTPSSTQDINLGEYDINNPDTFNNRAFREMDRAEVRAAIRSAIRGETRAKGMHFHHTTGKLLERKYGIRRCIIACSFVDKFDDSVDMKKRAVKLFLVERVILPHSEGMALAAECSVSGFSCTKLDDSDENGERTSQYMRDFRAKLQDYRLRHGETSLEELDKNAEELRNNGFAHYVIKRVAGETIAKVTTKFTPYVGWVLLTIEATNAAATAAPAIQHMNWVLNSTSAVQTFSMLRTSGDEIKTGNVDAEIIGSIASVYDYNTANEGGGGSMEASKLYANMIGQADAAGPQAASLFDGVIPKAYAAEQENIHLCKDGKPVPADKLVCKEMSADAQSTPGLLLDYLSKGMAINAIGNFNSALATRFLNWAADNPLFNFINYWIDKMTPEFIKDIIAWITNEVFNNLFVTWLSDKMNGATWFDGGAFGASVAANDVCHLQMGCKVGSAQQITEARERVTRERQLEFASLPLKDQLFSTDESESFVSRLALAMPNQDGSIGSFASSMLRGFSTLTFRGLANAFTAPAAQALTLPGDSSYDPGRKPSPSPFGDLQYFYPDHPVFHGDPEKAWDEMECENPEGKRIWGDTAKKIDKKTQTAIQENVYPCMLLRERISSMGGLIDKDLLLEDVSTDQGGGVGIVGNQAFPMQATQSQIKDWGWCTTCQDNQHANYNAADILAPPGIPILSATDGIVFNVKRNDAPCRIGPLNGGGSYPTMQIKAPDGSYYFYAHFESGSISVRVDDPVKAGQQIGVVGRGPCSESGTTHLHFQKDSTGPVNYGSGDNVQPMLTQLFKALPQ